MGVNSSCLTKLVMSRSLYIVTVVTLAATLLQAEDVESNLYSVEPVEPLQGDKVPTAFAVAHPKVAAKVRDASLQSDEESLVASSSYEEFYNAAYRKMQTLVQSGKKADECIKAAESSISSVLQEFKTTQKMLDNLDNGAKCTKKGQQEIKRAEYRWRKATKILETTNIKRKETDKDSCKKEVTAKEYQKTSLKEYVHAKKVAIELRRQCKCAVINNVHQLVQFSKTLIKVRAKTVVRETVLICIVKAEAKKKSSKSCRSKAFISSLEKATMQKLMLKKKVLAPGVASALCGPKEKKAKEHAVKEKPRKEKKKKEDKVKEKKNKEGGSKEGSRKESKGKEARNKVVEERKAKEKKSKELKRKEANAKERKVKDERNSKETRRKESVIKERKTKESISKEKRGKEKNGKEKRGKESKVKEKKEKESTRKIEVAKKEKTTKE